MHAQTVVASSQALAFRNIRNEDRASEESIRKLTSQRDLTAGHEQVRVRSEFVFAVGERMCHRLIALIFSIFLIVFWSCI